MSKPLPKPSPKPMRKGARVVSDHWTQVDRIWEEFSTSGLRTICELPEEEFAERFGLDTYKVEQRQPADFYAFKDNGSNILAVAHLDTVSKRWGRTCRFVDTEGGLVVHSRALDDRLGAYVILDLLPKLGLTFDLLLTVGEETGESTAAFFEPPKEYDWIIEFDRGGTDVVMYQYEDEDTVELVEASGADVGFGSLSDISYLEHVGVKAFNWGVGYQDYHGPRAHAYLEDTVKMVAHFLEFHAVNAGVRHPHEQKGSPWGWLDEHDEAGFTGARMGTPWGEPSLEFDQGR